MYERFEYHDNTTIILCYIIIYYWFYVSTRLGLRVRLGKVRVKVMPWCQRTPNESTSRAGYQDLTGSQATTNRDSDTRHVCGSSKVHPPRQPPHRNRQRWTASFDAKSQKRAKIDTSNVDSNRMPPTTDKEKAPDPDSRAHGSFRRGRCTCWSQDFNCNLRFKPSKHQEERRETSGGCWYISVNMHALQMSSVAHACLPIALTIA